MTTRNSPARMICSSTVGGCEHVPSSSVAMMARAIFKWAPRSRRWTRQITPAPARTRSGYSWFAVRSVWVSFWAGAGIESPPLRRGTEAVTTAPIRNRLRALRPYEGSNPSLSATSFSFKNKSLKWLQCDPGALVGSRVIQNRLATSPTSSPPSIATERGWTDASLGPQKRRRIGTRRNRIDALTLHDLPAARARNPRTSFVVNQF